ncbi:MAG: energy-coupling factor transporter transmembrane component T [Candidatus Cloacimonetes bacterium]|nr:energy-coupling factor transporter transmembrane protein EcfT [Candidatus Cloacimonadota bacterium]MDD4155984.1 energy-coupling factor transporter transmembrane component T [Candidatus Cloacimonadota bacterium]
MLKYHIKTLLILNIILTTAILLSSNLISSFLVFLCGLYSCKLIYDNTIFYNYLHLLKKFKALFLTILIFQILTRRTGEIYFEFSFFKITSDGFFYAFNSLLRYCVILLSAIMLGNASPFEMIKALRTWKIPETIVILVSFTIQFLRQFQFDFKIIIQNLKKRNIDFKFPGMYFLNAMKKRFELISHLIIPVLGKTISDIKYKVIAMELNGYGKKGKSHINFQYRKCHLKDYLFIFIFLLINIILLRIRVLM